MIIPSVNDESFFLTDLFPVEEEELFDASFLCELPNIQKGTLILPEYACVYMCICVYVHVCMASV